MSNVAGLYVGTVLQNDDAENRGRVVLLIPDALGSSPSNWAEPIVPSPYRPPIGDVVYVQFINGDLAHPVYSATRMLTADMIAALNIVIGSAGSPITIDTSLWEVPIGELWGETGDIRGDITGLHNGVNDINDQIINIWGYFNNYRTRDDAIIGAVVRTHDGALYGDRGISLSPAGFVAWDSDSRVTFSIESETGNVDTVGSFRTFHPDILSNRGIVINNAGLAGYNTAGTKVFEIDTDTGSVTISGPGTVSDLQDEIDNIWGTFPDYRTRSESIVGALIRSHPEAAGNKGVRLSSAGLTAWNSAGLVTFNVDSETGNVDTVGSFRTYHPDISLSRGVVMNADGLSGYSNAGAKTFELLTSNGNVTITGGTLRTTDNAGTGQGVVFASNGLTAYNSSGTETVRIAASGLMTLTGGITRTNASPNTLGGISISGAGMWGYRPGGDVSFRLDSPTGDITVTGGKIRTQAHDSRGVVMSSEGLRGYTSTGVETFSINAATGAVSITGGTTSTTNSRVVLDNTGLRGYNASMAQTFALEASSGNVTITGGTLRTSATAGTSQGVVFASNGITAYNSSGAETVRIAASGLITLTGGITRSNESPNTLGGVSISAAGFWGYRPGGAVSFQLNSATGDVTVTGGRIRTQDHNSRGVVMDSSGLRGYTSTGAETFSIDAATGAVTLKGSLTSGSTVSGASIVGSSFEAGSDIQVQIGNFSGPTSSSMRFVRTVPSVRVVGTINHEEVPWYSAPGVLAGVTYAGLQIHSPDSVVLNSGSATLFVDAGGNVGFNTSSPSSSWLGPFNGGVVVGSGGNLWAYSQVMIPNIDSTTSGLDDVVVGSGGKLYRGSVSLRTEKIAIEEVGLDHVAGILDVPVVTWFDRRNAERLSDAITSGDTEDLKDVEPIRRVPGVIAEDVEEAGLEEFLIRDSAGKLTGVSYNRLSVALIPVVKNLFGRVAELEDLVDSLTSS